MFPHGQGSRHSLPCLHAKKTKEVANLRIHGERAINRLMKFKILKNVVPINMVTHADSIVKTFAALCNLQSHLINEFSY